MKRKERGERGTAGRRREAGRNERIGKWERIKLGGRKEGKKKQVTKERRGGK